MARTSAANAALLLNPEGLATMAIAWVVFRENVDRRILIGEPITTRLLGAAVLMAIGLYLHLVERHDHEHAHDEMAHEHAG